MINFEYMLRVFNFVNKKVYRRICDYKGRSRKYFSLNLRLNIYESEK